MWDVVVMAHRTLLADVECSGWSQRHMNSLLMANIFTPDYLLFVPFHCILFVPFCSLVPHLTACWHVFLLMFLLYVPKNIVHNVICLLHMFTLVRVIAMPYKRGQPVCLFFNEINTLIPQQFWGLHITSNLSYVIRILFSSNYESNTLLYR